MPGRSSRSAPNLSTARKNGQHALAVLRDLFAGRPWLPAAAASP